MQRDRIIKICFPMKINFKSIYPKAVEQKKTTKKNILEGGKQTLEWLLFEIDCFLNTYHVLSTEKASFPGCLNICLIFMIHWMITFGNKFIRSSSNSKIRKKKKKRKTIDNSHPFIPNDITYTFKPMVLFCLFFQYPQLSKHV